MIQNYLEKATFPQKRKGEKKKKKKGKIKGRRQLLGNCVWLSGRMPIEERLNEGPRLQLKQKYEKETKQHDRGTIEKRNNICKPNARRIQVRASCG